jgi:hypothetical protein
MIALPSFLAVPTPRTNLAPLGLSVGCVQYLRAQRLVELGGGDGSSVSSWEDEAGAYDGSQGTAGLQPVLKTGLHNGKAAVRFDASDDEITHTSFTSAACWLVFRPTNITSAICYISASTGRGYFVDSVFLTSGPGMFDGTNLRNANGANRITSGSLVSLLLTPTKVYRNGSEVTGYQTAGSPSSFAVTTINGRPGLAGSRMAFDLCEIAHYNGAPTTADLALLHAHAQTYYGAP